MMWHSVLGVLLMFRGRQWEAPVLTVLSLAQFCLATMILGIYIAGLKIGNNPFLLVRQLFVDAPIFQRPDYLSIPQMQDGQNLNALLQNYWMVIHPPVLFLGFASTIVPFSFAIAGLWKKQYGSWTRAALPWTLFSCCVLGTGIMMGAAWAYESLTFGGYWAWDPVENASLVPWLVLVAGLHTQVIYNATGHSLRATHLFLVLGFLLVLYSTFLTRSGILGDESVHAFVGSGMDLQLILLIFVFLVPAGILYIKEYKKIPHINKEEHTYSREFWMFIGALVIFLSALYIFFAMSVPVFNKIFGTKRTIGDDITFTYNRIEIFIAIFLGILTAVVQYLKYKSTSRNYFLRKIWPPTLVALLLTASLSLFGGVHYDKYGNGYLAAIHLALFAGTFALVANTGYIFSGLKGKLKVAGASVAHAGFGLLLVGILLSSAKKEVLSFNTTGINLPFDPKSKENPFENITLLRNVKTDMGKYWTTYLRNDSANASGNTIFFQVNFRDKQSGETFDLYPNLIKNTKGQDSYSANPDKRHYLGHDIFTYVSYANILDSGKDTTGYKSYPVALHDTVYYSKGLLILDSVIVNPNNELYHFTSGDTALMARIRIIAADSSRYTANPVLFVKNNEVNLIPDTVFAQNLAIQIASVVNPRKVELKLKESGNLVPFLSLKVYVFPQINLVWGGAIIMFTGFIMSIVRRRRQTLETVA
jgi:cytochrome c-type biogenesis protein CcmF